MKTTPTPFRSRALTSLVVVLCFVALLVSGAVLFLSPPGRIANWTQWQMLGVTKHGWSDLHITFSAVFLVAALAHLAFNWRPLLQHLGARLSGARGFRPEWVVAVAIGVGVFAGTRAHLPPFSTLLAWSESLRGGWEPQGGDRAPIPHAELLALSELAAQAGVAPEEAIRRLNAAGLREVRAEAQVQSIADAGRITPAKVYDLILGRSGSPANGPGTGRSSSGPGAGGGPGWKTLTQFCADENLDLQAVQGRLSGRGIKAAADQTLREIAVNNGFERPFALLEILRQK